MNVADNPFFDGVMRVYDMGPKKKA